MQQEIENFHRAGDLVFHLGSKTKQRLFDYYLKSKSQTLDQFIEKHQHDIFHLYAGPRNNCCQCSQISSEYVLNKAQMEKLFQKSSKLPTHNAKIRTDAFCCSRAQLFLQPSDLDITLLHSLLINVCTDMLWDSCLQKQTTEEFFNDNENLHRLYHLWKKNKCCIGNCNTVNGVNPCIDQAMWYALFQNNCQPKCSNNDTCSFSCVPSLNISNIDKTLCSIIHRHLCPLRIALEKLVEFRNKLAHSTNGQLSNSEFANIWNDGSKYILVIAEYIDALTDIKDELAMAEFRTHDASLQSRLSLTINEYLNMKSDLKKEVDCLTTSTELVLTQSARILEQQAECLRKQEDGSHKQEEQSKITMETLQVLTQKIDQMELLIRVKKGKKSRILQTIFRRKDKKGTASSDTSGGGATENKPKRWKFRSKLESLWEKFRKRNVNETVAKEMIEYDDPNDKHICGGCQETIYGGVQTFLQHKRTCNARRQRMEQRGTHVYTGLEINNLPRNYEKRMKQEAKQSDIFSDSIEVIGGDDGSLILWTRISKSSFKTEKSFLDAILDFFYTLLQRHPLNTEEDVDIAVTVHILEDINDFDDLEGDLYQCSKCQENYTQFKAYIDHKKEGCTNKVTCVPPISVWNKKEPLSSRLKLAETSRKPVDKKISLGVFTEGSGGSGLNTDRDSNSVPGYTDCTNKIVRPKQFKVKFPESSSGTSGYETDNELDISRKRTPRLKKLRYSVKNFFSSRHEIFEENRESSDTGYETALEFGKSSSGDTYTTSHSVDQKHKISTGRKNIYNPKQATIIDIESDESETEVLEITPKLNYYEKSCKLSSEFKDTEFFYSHAMQLGLQLSKRCVLRIESCCKKSMNRKSDFYTEFVKYPKLLSLLERQPLKYKKGTLQIDSSHGAVCKIKTQSNEIGTVIISGRSKCGKAYTDDEVVVEILEGAAEHIPRLETCIKPTTKVYGQVIGVLERKRKANIDHPVYVCELDSFDNDKAKPICKTIPKLHLVRNRSNQGCFSVDVYKYNAERKDLIFDKSIPINPSRRRKYLFYVVFVSWMSVYPIGVVIDVHKSTRNVFSGMKILDLQFEIPTIYKPATVKKMQDKLDLQLPDLKIGREDLRKLRAFTIDPKKSVVLDDAISIDKNEVGYCVGVHISDVTAYIEKGDDIDNEAQDRGTTYFAGKYSDPHYMLPEPLSINTCSLLPKKLRLTMTIFLYFDAEFNFHRYKVLQSYIQSLDQLTYEQVQAIIDGKSHQLENDIKLLFRIACAVRKKRLGKAAWAVQYDFDLSEKLETHSNCFEAYFLIEEFMILANESVAQFLMQNKYIKQCVPLRCQDAPPKRRVQDWLKSHGNVIDQVLRLQSVQPLENKKIGLENLDPKRLRYTKICFIQKWVWEHFSNYLSEGKYREATNLLLKDDLYPLQALALDDWTSFQENAEYRCSGYITKIQGSHFGLNKYPYVHFTSPIRRYIDIVVHRLVHAALEGKNCPYTSKEVHDICNKMTKVTLRANTYENKCKSLLLAKDLLSNPAIVYGFVKDTTDQEMCLFLPGLRYLNEDYRSIVLNDLDVCCQPEFVRDVDTDKDILNLYWERRLYSRTKKRPRPKTEERGYKMANENEAQRIDPNQRIEVKLLSKWISCLNVACSEREMSENSSSIFHEIGRETNLLKYVKASYVTEYDVNSEIEKRPWVLTDESTLDDSDIDDNDNTGLDNKTNHISQRKKPNIPSVITNQSCNFSMSFSHGQVVAVQLSAHLKKGLLTPYIQLVDMTENVKFCTEHMKDPVMCLEKYSVRKAVTKYASVDVYKDIWLPIIKMESAINSVRTDTIIINEVDVEFQENTGKFVLNEDFCHERNIILGISHIEFTDTDIWTLSDEERKPYSVPMTDYLCIRCTIYKNNEVNSTNTHSLWQKVGPEDYYIWTTHAQITHVIKSNNDITVFFSIRNNASHPPSNLPNNAQITYCIEILPKSPLNKRIENSVCYLERAKVIAQDIALKRDTAEYDDGNERIRAIRETDISIGLPANNRKQNEAILMSLKKRFSLIHGPPGTGKTNTAIKLIYLFHDINKRIEQNGGSKKCILFCAPSNKSVDLVAVRFLNFKVEGSPKIVRLYGGSLANVDFPIPGKFYSARKGSRDEKPDALLRPITVHWLIRQPERPYAADIQSYEAKMVDKSKLRIKIIDEYTKILLKATQDELQNYDVIFCTTAVATNSTLFRNLRNAIHQVIIDECGMCTEPECLSTIISTRAEQVVLIGDHKQLKPIVQCQQAERLGLQKSLFERYCHGKNVVQLTSQYRMHKSICEFPSKKFYSGKLITAESNSYTENPPLSIWGTNNEKRHIFCHVEGEEDTLTVSTDEGNILSKSNKEEVKQVVKIFKYLFEKEKLFGDKQNISTPKCTINIMSQYNAQCKAIIKELDKEGYNKVNVNTVNGSQGGEWDYVIFSLVRSLPQIRIERYPTLGWCRRNLGFIIDENQINVALTRAKKGLFIVGNRNLLSCNNVWKKLIKDYGSQGCVYDANEFPKPFPKKKRRKKSGSRSEIDEEGFQKV